MATRRGVRTPKLAETLKRYRRGMSHSEAARRVQELIPTVSRGTIANYEKQARCPEIHILWALCRVYRAPFSVLADAMVREVLGLDVPEVPGPTVTEDEQELLDLYRDLDEAAGAHAEKARAQVKQMARGYLELLRPHVDDPHG